MIPSNFIIQPQYNYFTVPQYMPIEFLSPFNPYFPPQFMDPFAFSSLLDAHFLKSLLPSRLDAGEMMLYLNHTQNRMRNLEPENFLNLKQEQGSHSPVSLTSKSRLNSPDNQSSLLLKAEFQQTLYLPDDPEICLEAQVKSMVQFCVSNFNLSPTKEMAQVQMKFQLNPKLAEAFEALQAKYSTTTKTREEMVKWIIRRSFKATQKNLKRESKVQKKEFLSHLCKRYFSEAKEDSISDIVDLVLPFRKNSKNRTMNTNFIVEIFQSEAFQQDYKEFLKEFDEQTQHENALRIDRLTRVLLECIKKKNFDKISKYRRIPWLKTWIKATKVVAFELGEGNFCGRTSKKLKDGH